MPLDKLEITHRGPYAGGRTFGDVGAYELLEGFAHFTVDPLHWANEGITDLELAPRDGDGRAAFSSHFAMVRPIDEDQSRHAALFDVVNRGRKTVLGRFNSATRALYPSDPLAPGNGFLMRQGYTVVWCGWQADVPPTPGLIGMDAPEAMGPDGRLTGRMLCQFQANHFTQYFLLADRQHMPHPPADPDEASASLTVKNHPNELGEPIDRDQWSFVRFEDEDLEPEPSHIFMPSGFEPGRIYQLVYTTRGSKVVGLGFAAVRDTVSFLKHASAEAGNPCAGDIERAYAFGSSQSGRFLRQFIHVGVNQDEDGRMALDGIISHVAGGMRGEFNLRFGQPSKDVCYIIPELFPFTDTEQSDPVTEKRGSLLGKLEERGVVPKIMFINTSAEYWRGDAALIHTDLETMSDAPESLSVRRYHLSGSPHGSGVFPPLQVRPGDGIRGQMPFSCIDYNPLMRAALVNLDRWVSSGDPAPPSGHPSLDDGTALESAEVLRKLEGIPGVRVPPRPTRAMRLDYGPEAELGRTTTLPAIQGEEYPALVSDVDADGNELAGIRLPDLTVPVATYTGWNLRHPENGNPDLFIGITGGLAGWTLAFPATRADREAAGDLRASIEERYESREHCLRQVRDAAEALVVEGYLLAEDVDELMERAGARYDYFLGRLRVLATAR